MTKKLSPRMQEALTFYAWQHVFVSVLPGNVYLYQPGVSTRVALLNRGLLGLANGFYLTTDGWHALDVETAHGVALIMNRDRDDALTEALAINRDRIFQAERDRVIARNAELDARDCLPVELAHVVAVQMNADREDALNSFLCNTCLTETNVPGRHCTGTAIADHAAARITAARRAETLASSNLVTSQADIGAAVAADHIILTLVTNEGPEQPKQTEVWSVRRDSLWSVLLNKPFCLSAEEIMAAREMVNGTEEYGEHVDEVGRIMWAPAISLAPPGFEPDGPDVWVWKPDQWITLKLTRPLGTPALRNVYVGGKFVGRIAFDGKVWSEVKS